MADSVTASDIPVGQFDFVAGYVDGAYAWSGADWKLHDQSRHIRIAVSPYTHDADVLDVEQGDATPEQAGNWLRVEVDAGRWKVLYFSAANFAAVHAAALANGVQDDQWGQWVADWDGVAVLPPGPVAKQYANPTLSGGHYDLSVVADYWPGVDLAPNAGHLRMAAWLAQPNRPDLAAAAAQARWDDLFAEFLKEQWSDFLNRADVAPAWAAGTRQSVYGQWLKENDSAYWNRPDVQAGVSSGAFVGEYVKEQLAAVGGAGGTGPVGGGGGRGVGGTPIDQTRAAWANLGNFVTQDVLDFIAELRRLLALAEKTP